jgi:hypothetical protein
MRSMTPVGFLIERILGEAAVRKLEERASLV